MLTSTLCNFKEKFTSTLIVSVLLGYPPRELVSYSPDSSLHSLRIQTGETLFLEELPSDKARRNSGELG